MDYFEPRIEDNKFIFVETVKGGYLQRSSYASYDIISVWNDKLELLELKIGSDDMLKIFDKEGKPIKKYSEREGNFNLRKEFHYYRAIRARNRHLKYLKIFLGLEKKPEIVERQNYITTSWTYFNSKLKHQKLSQTKKGKPNRKELDRPKYTQYTRETLKKKQLATEYNRRLELFIEYRNKVFKELFGDKS